MARPRQKQSKLYRVMRDDGCVLVVTAGEFIIHVNAGNLIRYSETPRLAYVRRTLTATKSPEGRLLFEARGKVQPGPVIGTNIEAALENWLRCEPTISQREARERMIASTPRVLTEAVCLY
jgi:hypothetical protein